jgi:ribosomal protein S18 acetylase RimI-like enzyme
LIGSTGNPRRAISQPKAQLLFQQCIHYLQEFGMIRSFIPETSEVDFNLLLPAYLELANAPDALKFLSFTQKPFDESLVSNWFKSHLANGIEYFVDCTADHQIQGVATIKVDCLVGFELLGLVVRETSRGQGVGKGLVAYVLDIAQARGYQAIDVSVFADNRAMLRLLLGQGFVPVRMTHHARFDGADVVHLKRYLKDVSVS